MASYEVRVDREISQRLHASGIEYHEQNDMPKSLKDALGGGSKTESGTGTGRPDFSVVVNKDFCVVIENKYGLTKLASRNDKDGSLLKTKKVINDNALNGAYHYAKTIIDSGIFNEVLAIGIAGESTEQDLTIASSALYFFSDEDEPKEIELEVDNFDFLKPENFEDFHKKISLSDKEKRAIINRKYNTLQKSAKELNRIFYDHSIPVEQRVIFVSGMLLAMEGGLKPDGLKGRNPGQTLSDGNVIYRHIEDTLYDRVKDDTKRTMMLTQFAAIRNDIDRDKVREGVNLKGRTRGSKVDNISINKEIFLFIYENIFVTIDGAAHLDHLGEMYSTFLKYALGDGKENGIVLTPPYVTDMMCEILGVDMDSRVFDPCTGSGGFLVAAMTRMIDTVQGSPLSDSEKAEKIVEIKSQQLMGVENDVKMFSLAATNMILRGDGSSQIVKGSIFDEVKNDTVKNFKANVGILNPPFSYAEKGMPFTLATIDSVEKGGRVAVIIQESAGSGQATKTNAQILKNNTLTHSITMPGDLFQPAAGVQTSVFVFTVGTPHDARKKVRFIDFSDDGYKRTERGVRTTGNPDKQYKDIVDIVNDVHDDNTVDIDYIDDTIDLNGGDWTYSQHKVIDTTPTESDFIKTVGDYMTFELSMILSGRGELIGFSDEELEKVEAKVAQKFDKEEETLEV